MRIAIGIGEEHTCSELNSLRESFTEPDRKLGLIARGVFSGNCEVDSLVDVTFK